MVRKSVEKYEKGKTARAGQEQQETTWSLGKKGRHMPQYHNKISGIQPNHPIRRREGWEVKHYHNPKQSKWGGSG